MGISASELVQQIGLLVQSFTTLLSFGTAESWERLLSVLSPVFRYAVGARSFSSFDQFDRSRVNTVIKGRLDLGVCSKGASRRGGKGWKLRNGLTSAIRCRLASNYRTGDELDILVKLAASLATSETRISLYKLVLRIGISVIFNDEKQSGLN